MSSLSLGVLCSLSNLNLNLSNSNDCCEATFCGEGGVAEMFVNL